MTKNRTGIDLLSAFGTELMVLLLLALAVAQRVSVGRDRMRRIEGKLRRRAARRVAA